MNQTKGDPPDSEFEYKSRQVCVYAIHLEGKPGLFTYNVSIDGRIQHDPGRLSGITHTEAVGAGQDFARNVIDSTAA